MIYEYRWQYENYVELSLNVEFKNGEGRNDVYTEVNVIAKSGQRYDKTLNKFLLHVSDHASKDMYMLNYGIISNMNSLYYSSVDVLIDFINSVILFRRFL